MEIFVIKVHTFSTQNDNVFKRHNTVYFYTNCTSRCFDNIRGFQ